MEAAIKGKYLFLLLCHREKLQRAAALLIAGVSMHCANAHIEKADSDLHLSRLLLCE